VNEILQLKLPHNPLFHIYKNLLDFLIAHDITENEIVSLES